MNRSQIALTRKLKNQSILLYTSRIQIYFKMNNNINPMDTFNYSNRDVVFTVLLLYFFCHIYFYVVVLLASVQNFNGVSLFCNSFPWEEVKLNFQKAPLPELKKTLYKDHRFYDMFWNFPRYPSRIKSYFLKILYWDCSRTYCPLQHYFILNRIILILLLKIVDFTRPGLRNTLNTVLKLNVKLQLLGPDPSICIPASLFPLYMV